jgi:hypothetical protein
VHGKVSHAVSPRKEGSAAKIDPKLTPNPSRATKKGEDDEDIYARRNRPVP